MRTRGRFLLILSLLARLLRIRIVRFHPGRLNPPPHMQSLDSKLDLVRKFVRSTRRSWFELIDLAGTSKLQRQVADLQNTLGKVRIGFIKQDIQDDLYCCPRQSDAAKTVLSTLMRTGPIALFTRLNAEFAIVETETDPECQCWAEKAVDLGWYRLDSLVNLRTTIPGRDQGQSAFAVRCDEVNWSDYDIVISLDLCVPARITRNHPSTLWCYYIREPKTISYSRSQQAPLPGQDRFLNQTFSATASHAAPHSISFPYYLQYYGCIHEVVGRPFDNSLLRQNLFLEHHTPDTLTREQLDLLATIGPINSTARSIADHRVFSAPSDKSRQSPYEILSGLLDSKYFISCPQQRNVWGNATVEAVAAGSLVIGNPAVHTHRDLFSARTSVATFDALIATLQFFEEHPTAYLAEVKRQRRIVDYLCYWRPLRDLLQALKEHRQAI